VLPAAVDTSEAPDAADDSSVTHHRVSVVAIEADGRVLYDGKDRISCAKHSTLEYAHDPNHNMRQCLLRIPEFSRATGLDHHVDLTAHHP
jgi:hypothetical protein